MALLQMSWCGACLWRLWLSARTDGMARPNVSTRSVWLLRAVISTSEVPGAECHSMPQPMTASSIKISWSTSVSQLPAVATAS